MVYTVVSYKRKYDPRKKWHEKRSAFFRIRLKSFCLR